jgi:ketosteroid isomerase-like protein
MPDDAATVRELLAAFDRRDAETVAALVDEDATFEPLSTEAAERGAYVGPDGIRAYLRDLDETWRQFDLSIGDVGEVEGHVLATGRIYARARHTSLVADDPVAFAWELHEGRVVWGRVFTGEASARAAIAERGASGRE